MRKNVLVNHKKDIFSKGWVLVRAFRYLLAVRPLHCQIYYNTDFVFGILTSQVAPIINLKYITN